MAWYLGTRTTLMCFLQQGVMFTEVWHIMRFFTGTLIWYHTQTQYTQGPADWHTHINVYLHHLLCAQKSYFYHIKWLNKWLYKCTIQWYQKFTFHNVLSFQKVFTCKLFICWLNAMTNNTARNGASKQNTHTHNTHTHTYQTIKKWLINQLSLIFILIWK